MIFLKWSSNHFSCHFPTSNKIIEYTHRIDKSYREKKICINTIILLTQIGWILLCYRVWVKYCMIFGGWQYNLKWVGVNNDCVCEGWLDRTKEVPEWRIKFIIALHD